MVKPYYGPTPTPPAPKPARTCDELGICQGRTIPCLNCTRTDVPEWQPDEVTLTPIERMGYWITLTVMSCITAGTAVGAACYIYGRWLA